MKSFNLEKAKTGAPVCTRDGKPVRILCFDAKGSFPIVGLIELSNKSESPECWTIDGAFHDVDQERNDDLMMVDIDKDDESCVSDEFIEKLVKKLIEKMPNPWWIPTTVTDTYPKPFGDPVLYGTGTTPYIVSSVGK